MNRVVFPPHQDWMLADQNFALSPIFFRGILSFLNDFVDPETPSPRKWALATRIISPFLFKSGCRRQEMKIEATSSVSKFLQNINLKYCGCPRFFFWCFLVFSRLDGQGTLSLTKRKSLHQPLQLQTGFTRIKDGNR